MSRHESDTDSDTESILSRILSLILSRTLTRILSRMPTRMRQPDSDRARTAGRTGLGADPEPADEHPGEALARLPDGVCVCVCVCDREI